MTKFGYLVPQFPGQTHIFFWREIAEMERRGAQPVLLSTTRPAAGLIAHDWSQAAMARTTYLGRLDPVAALAALPRLPLAEILRDARNQPPAFLRDIALAAPAARLLTRKCREQGIAHVHVHSCGRAALVAALARRAGGPDYSLTLHGPLADYGPGQGFKWRRARFATVITQRLLDQLRGALGPDLPQRVIVQPMGVNTDQLSRDAPYRPAQPDEVLRLFTCARLNIVKGHEDLLIALRRLLDAGRRAELVIAGEDDAGGSGYRTVLEARIDALHLRDHVRLLGAVDAEEVKRQLRAAHLFVLASWEEPLGVALMEAMSCAVPVIGTNAGGVGELIADGRDGVLVPPRSPAALAAAIAGLADAPGRARDLAAAGRARILRRFDAGRGAETLLQEITRPDHP